MNNIVAIVGRPNVGKSTLFNRLTETSKAIVDNESGVTRDRHYGMVNWCGKEFILIDTGGYVAGSGEVFEAAIREQVLIAIEEASIILFMVDVTTGLTNLEDSIADILRKTQKEVLVVANKVDSNKLINESAIFYSIGLGEIYDISSITGSGTGELLDAVVEKINPQQETNVNDLPKFSIIGRPNAGKSSFINTLLGIERNIVTPIPGTTRDSIHVRYKQFGFDFVLIDTAGIRKKTKVKENIEFYSVMRSIKAMEESDVCILMIDAALGIEAQDINIFRLAQKNKKGILILINKWDLIEKDNKSVKIFEQNIKEKIAPFTDVPILFTSVLNKQRILKAMETAYKVYENKNRKITTSRLNEFILKIIENHRPPAIKGKEVKIKYVTQLSSSAPTFAFFCNLPQYIKEPYKRYLENKIREEFDFRGTPVMLYFRRK